MLLLSCLIFAGFSYGYGCSLRLRIRAISLDHFCRGLILILLFGLQFLCLWLGLGAFLICLSFRRLLFGGLLLLLGRLLGDRSDFLDCALCRSLLLNLLLSLVALIYDFCGRCPIVDDCKPVWQSSSLAETRGNRVFRPETIEIVGQGWFFRGAKRARRQQVFISANLLLLQCKHIVHPSIRSFLQNLLLSVHVQAAGHQL